MQTRAIHSLILGAALLATSKTAAAEITGTNSPAAKAGSGQGAVFGFLEENDLFVSTDRHYTQGIKFYFLHAEGNTPGCIDRLSEKLPSFGYQPEHSRFGYEVGQNIYTPGDISIPTYIPNDRPYAGWLYAGFILQRRGETDRHQTRTLESLTLDLGVVGPQALAGEAQTWVHEIRGFALPQGWRHQLSTEPGLQLKYQRQWLYRVNAAENWALDFVPSVGASLGNVLTSGHLGSMVRLGYKLPEDFGPQNIDSLSVNSGGIEKDCDCNPWLSAYIFSAIEGRAVGWNVTLDGNLFTSSYDVPKNNFVGDFKFGGVVSIKNVDVSFSYILRSPEFKGEKEPSGFGVFAVRLKF
ncbi:MAG TPA: lipid A deacylase LpxR family protein [Roseimicrobium sp.]|nr:lipid A deacylase LpxR family protein [Roseimicrobium sp.]